MKAATALFPWLAAPLCCLLGLTTTAAAQSAPQPYRLNRMDLKQQVIWGAECRHPAGSGLAFGGQDQDSNDGRPHTRVLVNGRWQEIYHTLRANNPLQTWHEQVWQLRSRAKNLLAQTRAIWFKGLPPEQEARRFEHEVAAELRQLSKAIDDLRAQMPIDLADQYSRDQSLLAERYLQNATQQLSTIHGRLSDTALKRLLRAQIQLELAAERLDAEPPPRAMNAGTARLAEKQSGPPGDALAYDATTDLYVLFGGDHLDYLTNDTWVFDRARQRWFQRHPNAAPPPRANHRLQAIGDGTIRMTGGYTYTSHTGYLSGQYVDRNDGPWVYDIQTNQWSGGKRIAADTRVYRSGPFHPNFYFQGDKPDAATFEAWLQRLPTNRWVPTNPPYLPRLNRDWGTARIDPDRDQMLRWSGGHSAHGGTDVLHFHFSTNRWELPVPVEFPLGQLYSNTSYPNGFNFNLRPWITGHTYQNYDYDPPSRMMIKAGRPRHFYIYDPGLGDWIGRGPKPEGMQYTNCFYDLTLAATPRGVIGWGKNGRVHRYDHKRGEWVELELHGEKLRGAYVDVSSMVYDSKRDRLLMINAHGLRNPFDGRVWSLDLKDNHVEILTPQGQHLASQFNNLDKTCYLPQHDLMLLGTYLKEAGEHTRTPAYDCQHNRWITLDIQYAIGERYGQTTRAFPHQRSDGLMFDSRRNLVWGTDANSQVYVLRLSLDREAVRNGDSFPAER